MDKKLYANGDHSPGDGDAVLIVVQQASILIGFRRALIKELIDQGRNVITVAPSSSNEEFRLVETKLKALGVLKHYSIPMRRGRVNPFSELKSLLSVAKIIKDNRPHTVIASMAKPILSTILPARIMGVRTRVALVEGLGYPFIEGREARRLLARLLVSMAFMMSLPFATRVVTLNTEDKNCLADLGFCKRKVISVVPGIGVPDEFFASSAPPRLPISFLFVGRLLNDKGIRELLDAAATLRAEGHPFSLRIVGDYDSNPASIPHDELLERVARADAQWDGYSQDVRKHISQCHVLVLPSYREGFPRSVMEALAMGRTAIVSDVPGCRSAVIHEKTGLLVRARDSKRLAEAMKRLIYDHELTNKMGKEAADYASKNWREDDLARRFIRSFSNRDQII